MHLYFLKYKKVGVDIAEDARCDVEIKRRIAFAKSAFKKLDNILRNCKMSMATRLRVLDCYVFRVLCYGNEAWTITADLREAPRRGPPSPKYPWITDSRIYSSFSRHHGL